MFDDASVHGDEVRKSQLTRSIIQMPPRDRFKIPPSFTEIVLGWSLEGEQLQETTLSAQDDIANVTAFNDIFHYYQSFWPLILEETRAMVLAGLQAAETNSGELTLELKVQKVTHPKRVENPSMVDFLKTTKQQMILKPGDLFLLQHSEFPDLKLFAIANYNAPTEQQTRVSFKILINSMRGSYSEQFQPAVEWRATYLTSIITMQRMYDVCLEKPRVSFINDLITGELTSEYNKHFDRKHYPLPSELNPSQQNAIRNFLSLKKGLQLVQGPPGTGKTTTIVYLLKKLLEQGKRILVCAPSNKAVQVLAERFCLEKLQVPVLLAGVEDKLLEGNTQLQEIFLHTWHKRLKSELAQILNKLQTAKNASVISDDYFQNILDSVIHLLTRMNLFRLLNEGLLEGIQKAFTDHINSCGQHWLGKISSLTEAEKEQQSTSLSESISKAGDEIGKIKNLLQEIEKQSGGLEDQLVNEAELIFCTLSVVGRQIMQGMEFDVLIVDEAGQAVEAEFLIALSAQPKKCLVIGDPQQLPATVISKEAATSGFGRSLMHRLIVQCKQPFDLLDTQYRMHPEISCWPSAMYYDGKLIDAHSVSEKPIWKAANNLLGPYSVINIEGQEQQIGKSKSNDGEALFIVGLLIDLKRTGAVNENTQVAIITFYSAQAESINNYLTINGLKEFKAFTVDSFQGSEADIVFVSCVRANGGGAIGFLQDFRRLNVAITRAKDALMIVGDLKTLKQAEDSDIARLILDAEKRNRIVAARDLQNQWEKAVISYTPNQVNARPLQNQREKAAISYNPYQGNARPLQNQWKKTAISHNAKQNDVRENCRFFRPERPDSCRRGDQCRYRHEMNEEQRRYPKN